MSALSCIILAAGHSKRMRSARVKVLHELLGRPVIYYPVKTALDAGADPVVVITGNQAEAVEDAIAKLFPSAPLRFARQPRLLGTADAVRYGLPALEGHGGCVLVLVGDAPLLKADTLASFIAAWERSGSPAGFISASLPDSYGYGRVVRAEDGSVKAIVEEKNATEREKTIKEVNSSFYLCDAAFLREAAAEIKPDGLSGEYYLTDLVEIAIRKGGKVLAFPVLHEEVIGINTRQQLAAAAAVLRQRVLDRAMTEGVTVVDPASTFIDESVSFGTDVTVLPGCHITGGTKIGDRCAIGPNAVVGDCAIEEDVMVKAFCVLSESALKKGSQVGPFTHLRPGTVIEEDARIGNFVELKKSVVGRGSKANHLSYIGDALVGAGVNIGAGTITCNYDGEKKHPTVIEDEVFVGSDTQFVAPVRVGRGAYVGAGSTITEDVPAGALAVSRCRQRNIEGYVKRKKARKAGK